MSIKALADVWALTIAAGHNLTPTEKLVLLAYANHTNEQRDSLAWPSIRTVAAECCLWPNSARQIVHRLVSAGYLVPVIPSRRYTPTAYRVVTSGLQHSRSAEASSADRALPRSGVQPGGDQDSSRAVIRTPTPLEPIRHRSRTETKARQDAALDVTSESARSLQGGDGPCSRGTNTSATPVLTNHPAPPSWSTHSGPREQSGTVGNRSPIRVLRVTERTSAHQATRRAETRRKGSAPVSRTRGPNPEHTGVLLADASMLFPPVDADTGEALARILADALIADLIDETRNDGRFPVGTRPKEGTRR